MNDFFKKLRVVSALAELAPTGVVVPPDLIFDDAPLEEVLYGEQPPRATNANVFRAARELFPRLAEAGQQNEFRAVLDQAATLMRRGDSLPSDVFEPLAIILSRIPAMVDDEAERRGVPTTCNLLEFWWNQAAIDDHNRMRAVFGIPLAFQWLMKGSVSQSQLIWRAQADAQRTMPDDFQVLFQVNALRYWQEYALPRRDECFLQSGRMLRQFLYEGKAVPEQLSEASVCEERIAIEAFEAPVVVALTRLARVCAAEGRKKDLERLHHLTILTAVAEFTVGPEHLLTANCLNLLVRFLQEGLEFKASLPAARRALQIRERTLEPSHSLIAQSLNNLGLSLFHCGLEVEDRAGCFLHIREAEESLQRSIEIDPDFPNPYYWLARVYQHRRASRDNYRELAAWRRYKELGPTSRERAAEAERRIDELADKLD